MRPVSWLLFLTLLLIIADACRKDPPPDTGFTRENLRITLKWIKSYPQDSREKADTGLRWALSFLGASLPAADMKEGIHWKDGSLAELDIQKLGFTVGAQRALSKIIAQIKKSDEYERTGCTPAGRFIMLTLNSTWHYYSITGAFSTLDLFLKNYPMDPDMAAIRESGVTPGERLIRMSIMKNDYGIAFMASEGKGSLADASFEPSEHEVTDLMPNGQFRFAVYDQSGMLVKSGNPEFSAAGKPAKCLWCHEIGIQPAFYAETSVKGFLTPHQFDSIVTERMKAVQQYRGTLNSAIDFAKKQDHTLAELLYISFMEPSASYLSQEWGMDEGWIRERLQHLSTHTHPEFPELGELYDRREVDAAAPFAAVPVPESAREYSMYEPDLIH